MGVPRPRRQRIPIPGVINPAGRREFCFVIPDDPDHFAAFWGGIERLTWASNWTQEPTHQAKIVASVWDEIVAENRVRFESGVGCGEIEVCADGECIKFTPFQPFITYAPNDPFRTPNYTPIPYPLPPWYTNPAIPLPGVLPTDAMVNGLAIIAFGDLAGIAIAGLPRTRIHFSGEGELEIELVRVPQGGWAYLTIDDNPLQAELIDLATVTILGADVLEEIFDLVLEGNNEVTTILEMPVETPGTHHLDITFLPQIGTDILLGFGGGLRRISFCGVDLIGESQAPMFQVIDCNLQYSPGIGHDFITLVDLSTCTIPGEPGTPGADGIDGINGANGAPGADGAAGAAGRPGRDGLQPEWCLVGDFRSFDLATVLFGGYSIGNGYTSGLDDTAQRLTLQFDIERPVTIVELKLPIATTDITQVSIGFTIEDTYGEFPDDLQIQAGVWEVIDDEVIRWRGSVSGVVGIYVNAQSPNEDSAIQIQGMSYCGLNPYVSSFAVLHVPDDCFIENSFEEAPVVISDEPGEYQVLFGEWHSSGRVDGVPTGALNGGRLVSIQQAMACEITGFEVGFIADHPNAAPFLDIHYLLLCWDEFDVLMISEIGVWNVVQLTPSGQGFALSAPRPVYRMQMELEYTEEEAGTGPGQRVLEMLHLNIF